MALELHTGGYSIVACRLVENWPRHMVEKRWVDLDEFFAAWCQALVSHGYGSPVLIGPRADPVRRMPAVMLPHQLR